MAKTIIWDMDGVLADTGEAHYRAWCRFFAEPSAAVAARLGPAPLSRAAFDATFGMANPEILRVWLGEGLSPAAVAEMAARKEALFREVAAGNVRLLPGVLLWLERARAAGYRQVVASSGEMANIVAVVGALGLGNYFDALLSGAFLPRSKPDPGIFLQAAAAAGAVPEEAIVIEDGIVGVEAARRAGMRCIAVTTTHPAERLAAADRIVARLDELEADALERLLER